MSTADLSKFNLDAHRGPVSSTAWEADQVARRIGKVEMFNATRPNGLDGWTMPLLQYSALRQHILDALESASDGAAMLGDVMESAKDRYLGDPLFRHARIRNLALYVALDMQARCEIDAVWTGKSATIRRTRHENHPTNAD